MGGYDEYIGCNKYTKNKFHGIESISDNSIIFELEIYNNKINFSDNNDLFRINDIYNRDTTRYEKSIKISEDLNIIF